MSENNRENLLAIVNTLEEADIRTWIFGGWAEELQDIIEPRTHKDFDLLYPAVNFQAVDEFIKNHQLPEVTDKHFSHKRAFLFKGILTELFLVNEDSGRYSTPFWGELEYIWPEDLLSTVSGMRVASPASLTAFRRDHELVVRSAHKLR